MNLETVGVAFMWLIFGVVALAAVSIVVGVATSIRHQRKIELLKAEAEVRRQPGPTPMEGYIK